MVLTKHTAQIATREKDTARAVVACNTGLFAEMWSNDVNFHCFCANQAMASLFIAIHRAQPRTKIAIAKVSVCERAFSGCVNGRE